MNPLSCCIAGDESKIFRWCCVFIGMSEKSMSFDWACVMEKAAEYWHGESFCILGTLSDVRNQ